MPPPSGSTPVLHVPYPVPNDTVDVPRDIKAVADWIELNTSGGGAGGGGILQIAPVLDVGQQGQVRAGRQLGPADFTSMGLAVPLGLWNLGDLTDVSGNGRALTNKGAVPFGVGINGFSTSAAVFAGSTGQALFIADTGAADPFRIGTGSYGCWFRTAKRGTGQTLISKLNVGATSRSYQIQINSGNVVELNLAHSGAAPSTWTANTTGVSDVCDDRWHLGIATVDGTAVRLYVDGVLEAVVSIAGPINASTGPLNIGAWGADGSAAANAPHYGRVDEAFVTADVLTDDQIRNLYCTRIAHLLAAVPTRVKLSVRRRRRGAALVVGDFPASPVRLHNFTNNTLADEGTNGVPLTLAATPVAGADGTSQGAMSFANQTLASTDAGLPAGTAARSYGCWFKTTSNNNMGVIGWGANGAETKLFMVTGGIRATNGADAAQGPFAADGQWHHAVVTEDNAAGDGVRRKLYFDGRCVAGSTVLNGITLAGANRFRVGGDVDGTGLYTGQIDGAFVHAGALTAEQIWALYQKSSQALAASPKEPGAHVEAMDNSNVLAVFDTLDNNAQVDLGVAA